MSLTSGFKFPLSGFRQALCALPLAWLWFVLINDLRVEWTVNPQYSYGWAVPFLCLFLIWQKMQKSEVHPPSSALSSSRPALSSSRSTLCAWLFALCAALYTPTRLFEEANPDWRLMSWALAIEVVGLTLIFIHLALGVSPLRSGRGEGQGEVSIPSSPPALAFQPSAFSLQPSALVFPLCFFLVAVPWPTVIEQPIIQGLTRADTDFTTELLGWLGIPAMPHGNVIEVSTGMVGIDEACSGIRSFQATLMLSLFLGEFYRLTVFRRSVLCLAGFAFSFLFNLARMSLLIWVAASKGVAAIASWHDPAGVTILVACLLSLWGLGVLLKGKRRKAESENEKAEKLKTETLKSEISKVESGSSSPWASPQSGEERLPITVRTLALALGTWIVINEVGIESWYRWHEARAPVAAQWTVAWPENAPSFKEKPLAEITRQTLRYDEGRSAIWQEGDLTWQAVFLHWKPGRAAIHLGEGHTPEICMTAAGHTLKAISPQEWFVVNGIRMPFLAYQVMDAPQPFFVFYCLWDDRASAQGFLAKIYTYYSYRIPPVMAGLRNPGQRSLEIAVSGPDSAAEAEAAVREELKKLVVLPKHP